MSELAQRIRNEVPMERIERSFVARMDDTTLIKIGHEISTKVLTDTQAVWQGYEHLKYGVDE